jgi:ubiquitin carboxyl-terminal hydrolase 10
MCFVNAVLQLLVHSSRFWDLFKGLGDLKGQRGARRPETYDSTTPLVDAMARLFEEFMFKEKEPPPTRQPLQQVTLGKTREDEESEKEHNAVISFEPTYMYDAMKGKRQLDNLLVREYHIAPCCY